MLLVIDRFEGDMAVLELGDSYFHLPRTLLPKEAREGDVLRLTLEIDEKATTMRRQRVNSLLQDFWK